MKIGGGIISLLAGLISVVMGFITLAFGGFGSAIGGEGAETIVGMGWAGIFLSFILIGFSVAMIVAKSKKPAVITAVLSIITAIAGGTFVAIFMVLSLIGAFINYLGVNGELKTRELEELTI